MRKLVTIRTVGKITPIEGADKIELAHIDGWQCVVKKGEFKEGDDCVYFEVDSFIPSHLPFMEGFSNKFTKFEGEEGLRVRTMKLRKTLSQGLAMPIEVVFPNGVVTPKDLSLEAALGVKKWERPIPLSSNLGEPKSTFPSFIPKTDQERVQNIPHVLNSDELFEVTLKLDGSSITLYCLTPDSPYNNTGETYFGVCSRNLEIKHSDHYIWKMVDELGIRDALECLGKDVALQCELIAPNIQGNFEGVEKPELHIYDVFDIEGQRYLPPELRKATLQAMDLEYLHIKELGEVVPSEVFKGDIEKALDFAEGSGLYSGYREGVVLKSFTTDTTFKIISNQYLLREK